MCLALDHPKNKKKLRRNGACQIHIQNPEIRTSNLEFFLKIVNELKPLTDYLCKKLSIRCLTSSE